MPTSLFDLKGQESLDLILHIGKYGQLDPSALIDIVKIYAHVKGYHTVNRNDLSKAIRVSIFGTLRAYKSLRLFLSSQYPTIRIKLIPTGEILERKLFIRVGNNINKADIQAYFGAFGSLKKIELKISSSTSSSPNRNYCFVTYEHKSSIERVMAIKDHLISGKKIFVELCRLYQIQENKEKMFGEGIDKNKGGKGTHDTVCIGQIGSMRDESRASSNLVAIETNDNSPKYMDNLSKVPTKDMGFLSKNVNTSYKPISRCVYSIDGWLYASTVLSVDERHRGEGNIRFNYSSRLSRL